MTKCETVGCDDEACYIDLWDNRICQSCMEQNAQEENLEWDDYEYIPPGKEI